MRLTSKSFLHNNEEIDFEDIIKLDYQVFKNTFKGVLRISYKKEHKVAVKQFPAFDIMDFVRLLGQYEDWKDDRRFNSTIQVLQTV